MRAEHKDIKGLLDEITALTEKGDGEETTKKTSALTFLLSDHNMKEEEILYPESDSMLPEAERPEIVQKAQRF